MLLSTASLTAMLGLDPDTHEDDQQVMAARMAPSADRHAGRAKPGNDGSRGATNDKGMISR
jgi:hypothetical protein